MHILQQLYTYTNKTSCIYYYNYIQILLQLHAYTTTTLNIGSRQ